MLEALLKEGGELHKTALVKGNQRTTYRELSQRIYSLASFLDILPGDRVILCAENRPEWVYALYGSWHKGAVVVPVDFMSSAQELLYILKETEPAVVFYSEQTKEAVLDAVKSAKAEPKLYNLDSLSLLESRSAPVKREPKDIALILYTSGTTGSPKGVMLSFENLMSNIKAIEKVGVASREDKTVALLPFHHSYPLMVTLLVPLYLGATVVFLEKLSSEELLKVLKEEGITILVGVPRLYQLLHQRIMEKVMSNVPGRLLFSLSPYMSKSLRSLLFRKVHRAFGGKLRLLVSGGAKLPFDIALDLSRLGFTVLEGYGLTETSPIVSFNPPRKPKLGSVGIPIEGVQVKVAEDGELLVRGINVMQGYYKKPEETRKAFKDGWLLTGDVGYTDKEGYIYITGRKKELLVLSGGKKVNPEEIEALILKEGKGIKEVAVLEVEGSLRALILPDFQKLKEEGILNVEEYIRWQVVDRVNQKLPEWKRITGFRLTKQELPKTRLGKIRRFLLSELYQKAGKAEEKGEEDPVMQTQEGQRIKYYLESLTQKPARGYHHIELDLGLDSLGKVEFLSFLETAFGVRLEEEELAKRATLQEVVKLIIEKKEKEEYVKTGWKDILLQGKPCTLEKHPVAFHTGRLLLKLFFKLYNRMEVKGIQNLPEPPFILAPNHASYLDGFVIASALPAHIAQKTYFLGAEEYFKGPVTSFFGRLAHVITVNLDKKLKLSLQKTAWALKDGKAVVIFPEGARTRDGKLLPFKKGFAILSKELSLPVVPVALKGTYEALSLYHRFPRPFKIQVVFGKPINPEGKDYDQIVQEAQREIENMLGSSYNLSYDRA